MVRISVGLEDLDDITGISIGIISECDRNTNRSGWSEPSAAERLALLNRTKSVAMVGVSANAARPSNFVATYLLSSAQISRLFLPNGREILGQPYYASLAELPEVLTWSMCFDVQKSA